MKASANSNAPSPAPQDYNVARGAGGLTISELHARGIARSEAENHHYIDEHTNLWIPRGVLLFRPWRRPKTERDTMQLDD